MPEENYDEEYVITICNASRIKLEIRTTVRGPIKTQFEENEREKKDR